MSPLPQIHFQQVDREAFRKYQAGETVNASVSATPRDYGMCMEFANADALKAYDADPFHKIWTAAYEKVRVDGTTTFNIPGR